MNASGKNMSLLAQWKTRRNPGELRGALSKAPSGAMIPLSNGSGFYSFYTRKIPFTIIPRRTACMESLMQACLKGAFSYWQTPMASCAQPFILRVAKLPREWNRKLK